MNNLYKQRHQLFQIGLSTDVNNFSNNFNNNNNKNREQQLVEQIADYIQSNRFPALLSEMSGRSVNLADYDMGSFSSGSNYDDSLGNDELIASGHHSALANARAATGVTTGPAFNSLHRRKQIGLSQLFVSGGADTFDDDAAAATAAAAADFNTETQIEALGGLTLWQFTAIIIGSLMLVGLLVCLLQRVSRAMRRAGASQRRRDAERLKRTQAACGQSSATMRTACTSAGGAADTTSASARELFLFASEAQQQQQQQQQQKTPKRTLPLPLRAYHYQYHQPPQQQEQQQQQRQHCSFVAEPPPYGPVLRQMEEFGGGVDEASAAASYFYVEAGGDGSGGNGSGGIGGSGSRSLSQCNFDYLKVVERTQTQPYQPQQQQEQHQQQQQQLQYQPAHKPRYFNHYQKQSAPLTPPVFASRTLKSTLPDLV